MCLIEIIVIKLFKPIQEVLIIEELNIWYSLLKVAEICIINMVLSSPCSFYSIKSVAFANFYECKGH